MRQAEKDRKKILSRIPFTLEPGKKISKKKEKKIYFRIPLKLESGKKIPKKIAKKLKKLKNLSPNLFLA